MKVSETIDQFLGHSALGAVEIRRVEATSTVEIVSKVARATLIASDGALVLQAELSLIAMPFRSKLDEGLEKWRQRHFG